MAQAQNPPGRILTTGNNLQIIDCNIDASNCFTIFQEYEGNISFPSPQSPSVANNGMIAFISTVAPDGSCPGGCNPHVFVVNADGTNVRQLTDSSSSYNNSGEHHPVISPDGTMVAFLSNLNQAPDGTHQPEVYVINTDGSNLRQVTPFQQDPNNSSDWSAYMTGIAWSPDSKSLAFRGALWTFACGTYSNNPAFGTAIGTIGADGSNLQVLTCDGNDGYVDAIAWSPDGSLLAWNRNVNHCAQGGSGCAGEPAMAFYDFTGQNRYSAGITSAQLNTDSCQGDVHCVNFSPDGTQLAYRNTLVNSGGCVGQCYLSIISLDGSTRTDTSVPAGGDFWWMAGPAVPAAARMTLDPPVLEFWPGFSRQLLPSLLDGGGNLIMHTANAFTNPFLYAQMCQPQIGPYGLMTSTIYPGNTAAPAELNASNAGLTSANVPFSCWPSQPCTYSLSSNSQNFGNSDGQGSVGVIADPGQNQSQCPWNATSSASWIMINSPAYGEGAGTSSIGFTVAANSGGQRQGSITVVPGGTFTITQDAFNTVTLQSIAVNPASTSVAAGLTQQFTATGTYSDSSTQNLTSSVTWSSSDTSTATIAATGVATGVKAGGPVTITATQSGISGAASLTVTAPTLQSIAVTPASASVAAGLTQPFMATGHYSDNSTQDLTSSVTWSSADMTIATVAGTGVATGVKVGGVTITVMQGSVSGTASLTVTAAVLQSITVAPNSSSVAAGLTQPFTATGHYSDSSAQNLTSSVTWSSSNTSIATVASGTGVATGVSAGGPVTITAAQGRINGTASLTVTAATLQSITVNPGSASVAAGLTQPFTATGHYSDGSTQNLTTTAAWSSSNTGLASISNTAGSQGLAKGLSSGGVTIKATQGAISGTASLTVTAPQLISIAVTPTNPSVPAGSAEQFAATGNYTDGSMQNITNNVTWASSNQAVATINSSGLASAVAGGATTVSATLGVSGSTTMTVITLQSITIAPLNASVVVGQTLQYAATGHYSNGSTHDVTSAAVWSSSKSTIASITSLGGLATGHAKGSTTIKATVGGFSASTTLNVNAITLVSISVTPNPATVAVKGTLQFTATGHYNDGSSKDITDTAAWSASPKMVVSSVSSTGLATAGSKTGTATITAKSGMASGSATLTVQ